MLREFGRVSRRWIIADYRHKYSFRYGVWKIARTLGLTKRPFERVSVKSMKAEFEDAGLRVVKDHRRCVAGSRTSGWYWLNPATSTLKVSPRSWRARSTPTSTVTDKLGEGKRSVVYRGRWQGRDVGHQGIQARGHREPRAQAQTAARGVRASPQQGVLRGARPGEIRGRTARASWSSPGSRCRCRNCLDGEVYYFAQRDHADFISPRFMDDLADLVSLSHEAQPLRHRPACHERDGRPHKGTPKLFDFNQIPFTERPQNPVHRVWRSSSGC